MSTATAPRPMTVEELDALPDDGMERELIRGELRERPRTRRNRRHSRAEIKIGKALDLWLDAHADRGGEVVGGEAGFILRRDPDTNVGIDVAYVSAEVAARRPEAPDFEGPPVLAVEILSPSDTQEAVDEKVTLDLESGVAVIWVVNPRLRTITVFRPGSPVQVVSSGQELDGEPELAGFRANVDDLLM
jgi:Uma2 family endonuclease